MATVNVASEVTGKVWKFEARIGDEVDQGDVLMILESMKMEIPVESPVAGTVKEFLVDKDESVDEDQVIVVIEQ